MATITTMPAGDTRTDRGTPMTTVMRVESVMAPAVTLEMMRESPYQMMMLMAAGITALNEWRMPSGTTSGMRMTQLWSVANLVMRTDTRPISKPTKMPLEPRPEIGIAVTDAPAALVYVPRGAATRK